MKDTSRGWWIVLQGTAILASILLAFGIEAWWAGSQESNEANDLLRALQAELRSNVEAFDREREFRAAKTKSARAILDLALQDSPDISVEDFDALLGNLTWTGTTALRRGAFDSIIQGGRLQWIEPVELRTAVAGWGAAHELTRSWESQAQESYARDVLPYLIQSTNLPQIMTTVGDRPGVGVGFWEKSDAPSPTQQTDHRALLRDTEFLGLITREHWEQDEFSRVYYPGLIQAARQLDAKIEEALSESE